MKDGFAGWFIKGEYYLQNSPIESGDFARLCQNMGIFITENNLEEYEKAKMIYPILRFDRQIYNEEWIEFKRNGQTLRAYADYVIKDGEELIKRYKEKKYSSFTFSEPKWLARCVDAGILYDPSNRLFKPWKSFIGKAGGYDKCKTISFYTNFQLLLVDFIKEKTQFYKEIYKDEYAKYLKKEINKFKGYIRFLLAIQNVYYPYALSDSGNIKLTGINYEEWRLLKRSFNYNGILDKLSLEDKDIIKLYHLLAERSIGILGISSNDWIYLWRSISWDRKNELKGAVRRGVEYFQWAIMMKRVLEEHYKRGIPDLSDITRVSNEGSADLVKKNIDFSASIRKRYYDEKVKNDHYDNKRKRLFYLANDFKLDYQPRVFVFVEGDTEESIFPQVFRWYYGSPEMFGISIINFKGVDKLISNAKEIEKLRRVIIDLEAQIRTRILSKTKSMEINQLINKFKSLDIVISNWTSFLGYNLEQWQIIPFFVSDNEGGIKHFLEAEKPIRFEDENYDVPSKWRYLWGIDNVNIPFKGSCLELANFNDDELAEAISEILNEKINRTVVEGVRNADLGINKIHPAVQYRKKEITNLLIENLLKTYKGREREIVKRPIFKVVERITDLSIHNHPPIDTIIERQNKEFIRKELKR